MGSFDRPSNAPDTPDEPGASARKASERSDSWLNLDNASDEDLIAFLGLDRPDRVEPGTPPKHVPDDFQPAGKSQVGKPSVVVGGEIPPSTTDQKAAHIQAESRGWPALRDKLLAAEGQTGEAKLEPGRPDDRGSARAGEVGKPDDSLRHQQDLGKEMAGGIEKEINRKIDKTVDDLNPKFDRTKSAYRENCTGVVQAYELQRRDVDVQPGPLEKHLRTDEGGFGGRSVQVIEQAWGRSFSPGTRADIESAFGEPGSRGVIYIQWNRRGAHVFNVENVGGGVRFVDGQPTPAKTDASHYFNLGHSTQYLRLDDLPTPPDPRIRPYFEP